MASFSQLFRRAWWVVFYSKKSFLVLFILTNVVNFVVFWSLHIAGYNPMNQADVLRMMSEVWPYVFFMGGTLVFGTIFGFFTQQYSSQIFLGKWTSFQITISSWKRIFPAIGTYFCGLLFWSGLYVALLIGMGLLFWIWALWVLLVNQVSGTWHFILIIIGVLWAISYVIFLCCAFIWSIAVFFAFSFPAFFLDDIRYFDVMITSMKLIRKRWWRTFGMMCLISLCAMIIIVPLSLISSSFVLGSTLNAWVLILISSIQSVVGMCMMTFTYALYEDYKKHPMGKIAQQKIMPQKKTGTKKRASKIIKK